MSWMPDLLSTLNTLKYLEAGNDALIHSCRLFWLFSNHIVSPEKNKEKVTFWNNKILEAKIDDRHGFDDPEVEALLVQAVHKPEEVELLLINRLDDVANKYSSYLSQHEDDLESLFISLNFESARLARILRNEGFSGNSKIVLDSVLDAFSQCDSGVRSETNLWPKYITASLKILGSFLYVSKLAIQRSDSNYEDALQSFLKAIRLLFQSRLLIKDENTIIPKSKLGPNGEIPEKEYLIFNLKSTIMNFIQPMDFMYSKYLTTPDEASWKKILDPQTPVDCFEALKQENRKISPKSLVSLCEQFIELFNNNPSWLWRETVQVKDGNGHGWEPAVYWYSAIEWTNAQLNPSDLQELLQCSEDKAAENRLITYFFSQDLWEKLPRRAQQSLINADRDWFSRKNARIEAVLNEIRTATEEILYSGVWISLSKWTETEGKKNQGVQEFLNLKIHLEQKRYAPSLIDFEKILAMPICREYFKEKGYSPRSLYPKLTEKLSTLRMHRAEAEHISGTDWTRQELVPFVNQYLGIGQPGILPQLAKLLFSHEE